MTDREWTVGISLWEHDEYIVTLDGQPIGRTVTKQEGRAIFKWLPSALSELTSFLTADNRCGGDDD